jgi:hypothetical protein
MNSLSSVKYKIDRAGHHLNQLDSLIRGYFELEPYRIMRHEESETGDLIYRLQIRQEVPLEIAGVAGDVVHNLRSALDHLIWRIVELSSGTPSRATSFPIRKDKNGFDNSIGNALDGANSRAKSLVRHLRPYRGANDTLWKLHNLDIVDKHRLLIGVGAVYKHLVIEMQMEVPWESEEIAFPPIALNPADKMFPLQDGDELFRVKSQAREDGPGMKEPKFTFEIAFGDGESVLGEPMVPTLRDIHRYVSRIVAIADKYVV